MYGRASPVAFGVKGPLHLRLPLTGPESSAPSAEPASADSRAVTRRSGEGTAGKRTRVQWRIGAPHAAGSPIPGKGTKRGSRRGGNRFGPA